MIGSSRRASARIIQGVLRWGAAWGVCSAVGVAAANPPPAFVMRVKSPAGTSALVVGYEECVWDAAQQRYTWELAAPYVATNPSTGAELGTVVSARVQLYVGASPRILLDCVTQAGPVTTTFILTPGVIAVAPPGAPAGGGVEPLLAPEARATVSLSAADQNDDGVELRAVGAPGTGIYQARLNGLAPVGTLFSSMVWQLVAGPGGSAKVAQYEPPTGYRRVAAPVHDMSVFMSYTLSAGDIAQAATTFRVRFVESVAQAGSERAPAVVSAARAPKPVVQAAADTGERRRLARS